MNKLILLLWTLVGISAPLTIMFNQSPFLGWTLRTGASPFPVVFSDRLGFEPWGQYDLSIEATLQDGSIHKLEGAHDIYDRISGPHRIIIATILPVVFDLGARPQLEQSYLRWILCGKRKFYQDFAFPAEARSVSITVRSPNARLPKYTHWERRVECAP